MNTIHDLADQTIDLACTLQQIPAPTFLEIERAQFVLGCFQSMNLAATEIDSTGNTWGLLPGGDRRPLVISAHMDTVFPAGLPLNLHRQPGRITGPGIGDNALGLAALINLTGVLQEHELPGDVHVVATVGEEGMGNLAGMQAVVNRLGSDPFAYIVLEGIGLGSIYHRGLGVERYKLEIHTPGGHSWANYGVPSAIHELSRLIARLDSISLPNRPRTSFNVGTISGGTSVNTIATQAACTVDLRSEDHATLDKTIQRMRKVIAGFERRDVTVKFEMLGRRPAGEIPESHPLVQLAKDSLARHGIPAYPGIGSTDANVPLSRSIPAACIGITTGGNAHTSDEFIMTELVSKGMAQLLDLAQRAWNIE